MKKRLTTQEDYRQRVDRVAMYIREHLDSEIDIRTLAKGDFHARGNFCYEKYVSDPRRTPPEKRKTEIYIPIE